MLELTLLFVPCPAIMQRFASSSFYDEELKEVSLSSKQCMPFFAFYSSHTSSQALYPYATDSNTPLL